MKPLLTTLWTSAAVGVLCVLAAAPMSWLVSRTDLPGKRLLRTLILASFVTPPFLGAFAWVLLGGPNAGPDTASSDAGGSTSREAPEAASGPAQAPTYALKRPVPIRPDRFSRDVARVRLLTLDMDAAQTPRPQSGGTKNGTDNLLGFACRPAAWGAGTFVPVTYGGEPAVLVLRRVTGDTQVVDLFECGSSDPLRSITLPAP